jgi:Putative Ig domain
MLITTKVQQEFPWYILIVFLKKIVPFKAPDSVSKLHLTLKLGLFLGLLLPGVAIAGGTWTQLASAPPAGVNNCILLSDGTVLGMNGDGVCVKLTPDIHGSYVHGTWKTLAAMNQSRLFFSSQLLTNGNLWVAGGEDGAGGSSAELYDTLNNVWTVIPPPASGYPDFSDSISEILPDGNPLVCPVYLSTGCLIYNVISNNWQTAASCRASQDEADWVKLPGDNIVTIDAFSQNSEHYIPSLNEWVADGRVPVPLYDSSIGELGSGHLLPNGKVFYLGSTTNTAIYTPGATITSPGTWVAGASIPNGLGAPDAPAAMMVNGKILCCLGPWGTYNGPSSFYEYDYTDNTFAQVNAPDGGSTLGNTAPLGTSMLDLPDGTVLFVDGQNSSSLYIYTPDGAPLAAGQPVINSITENSDGSYHLTGTGLNGISEGAAYGDDEQMNDNYPLVRLTNNVSKNVYYARTYNWNSTSVQTGNQVLATEFTLPQNLPAGTYSLVVTAVGNPSAPQTFNYAPPSIPIGLTATGGSNGLVNLNWDASTVATAYNVKRSATTSGYFATIATVSGLKFADTGLTNGLTYYYKVSAVGSGGPSSDSASVSATPVGPPLIPGATPVSLTGYYNRTGIYTDGQTFATGVDGSYSAYSANLLGPSALWNNLVFDFGPANVANVVYCAGQTITLPAGRFNTLQILATGVQGNQAAQTFKVTYTDNSTATFTRNFSDWANPQSYPGEFTVLKMPYRALDNGGSQTLNVTVDGYVFTLDQTKTVKSITLPNNSNLVLLSMTLANNPATVSLAGYYNRAGIYTDATTFTNPPTGGVDGVGSAYSGTLLGNSQTWNNTPFAFGPLNATNVISCAGQTITLPPGNYSRLEMLGTGVNGSQAAQPFVVTYTDSTTSTFAQGLSDWFSPESYAGESRAVSMSHRDNANGTTDNRTFYLYGYSFALNSTKTIQSLRLPDNANDIITAISLVPNWPPTFNVNPFSEANADVGYGYSGTIATNTSDLNGDTLAYAKVSGPAWLNVAANGVLSGTPLSADIGDNSFQVSVTDSGGLSNTATMNITVRVPSPIVLTITPQAGGLLLNWSGGAGPYQLQAATNLVNPNWQNIGGTISSNSFSITPTEGEMFYRAIGQ